MKPLNVLMSVDWSPPTVDKFIDPIIKALERNGLLEVFFIVLAIALITTAFFIIRKYNKKDAETDLEETLDNFSDEEKIIS